MQAISASRALPRNPQLSAGYSIKASAFWGGVIHIESCPSCRGPRETADYVLHKSPSRRTYRHYSIERYQQNFLITQICIARILTSIMMAGAQRTGSNKTPAAFYLAI